VPKLQKRHHELRSSLLGFQHDKLHCRSTGPCTHRRPYNSTNTDIESNELMRMIRGRTGRAGTKVDSPRGNLKTVVVSRLTTGVLHSEQGALICEDFHAYTHETRTRMTAKQERPSCLLEFESKSKMMV